MAKKSKNKMVDLWIVKRDENGDILARDFLVWVREINDYELYDIFGVLLDISDIPLDNPEGSRFTTERKAIKKVAILIDEVEEDGEKCW